MKSVVAGVKGQGTYKKVVVKIFVNPFLGLL
jgi:hypothetical protein